ncbi:MAG: hypothetical protein E7016_05165 [Alphaproteobacteria bacterium]|nr:hypothetical protein [Alphaproteobacteria bacterium]
MKKNSVNPVNLMFTVVYIIAMVMFFAQKINEVPLMVLCMSHFFTFAAMLFRKAGVKKADLFKSFTYLVIAITVISWLPISGMWTLVPFWVCGFFHTLKVSHKSLMGHLYSEKPSREQVVRDLFVLWIMASMLVTICVAMI